ncbi:serine/threonine-protein kinase [Kitasatospora terrestris]|uniref:non-specific serine/threonine protein kinase n=1 Tax=Kitasatospora terrestris TaxID=258051 RepID=A0ABP9D5Y7_9ACTN
MRAGDVLGGRYRIDARIGQGGMGEVWQAFDVELGRPVALKVLLEFETGEEWLRRFRREASIGARLQHPGITVVHDIGRHGTRLFIVMELLRGTDLGQLISRNPDGLPVSRAVDLAAQAAGALAAAHAQQVVHRDLKPGNLFLLSDGRLKLCDFGIARTAQATQGLTQTGRPFGTPAYMAPEQWRGEHVDARCDLYALGCVLHALLTGRPPFPEREQAWSLMRRHLDEVPPPPSTIRADVPAELDRLVASLLAKDPARRPDATAVAAALTSAARTAGDHAPTPPPPPPPPPPPADRLPPAPVGDQPPVPPQPGQAPSPRGRRERSVAVVCASVLAVGAVAWAVSATRDTGRGSASGGRSAATTGSSTHLVPSPTRSATASPSPTKTTPSPYVSPSTFTSPTAVTSRTAFDPGSLDSADTDRTPLTTHALLPENFTDAKGVLYTMRSGGVEPCVDGRESSRVRTALTRNGCRGTVAATYTDTAEHILVVVTVAAMPDATAAGAARADLLEAASGEWAIWCPPTGPAAAVCTNSTATINRATQAGYLNSTHRYVTEARALYISLTQDQSIKPWLDSASLAASYSTGPQNYLGNRP